MNFRYFTTSAALVLASMVITGCAGYTPPRPSEPQAELYVDGPTNWLSLTSFGVYDNPCHIANDQGGPIGATGAIGASQVHAAIRVDKPLYFWVSIKAQVGYRVTGTGTMVIKFTPQNGSVYDAKVTLDGDWLKMNMVERATGLPPSGAEFFGRGDFKKLMAGCKR